MYVGGFGAFPRPTNTFPSNMMDGPQAFWGLEFDAPEALNLTDLYRHALQRLQCERATVCPRSCLSRYLSGSCLDWCMTFFP